MRVKYYDFAEARIPDERIKAILEPPQTHQKSGEAFEKDLHLLLEEKLTSQLSGVKSLLILVDDITRQTPTSWILPVVLDHVTRCGISKEAVDILVATGTLPA
jgi:nickel-dependent lactate racemase